MLDQEDLKWIATTATELNAALQQISRYADIARQQKGDPAYVAMLGERVEMAAEKAQALFDRVTSNILASASGTAPTTTSPFTVVPALASVLAAATKALGKEEPKQPEPVLKTPPIASADPSAIPPEIRVVNPKGKRELILFVDDELEVMEIAGEMLAEEGYRIIQAKDGFEALKIYGRVGKQIGLVILDFFLPVMDGDVVFDELRSINPNVNVVLSSGFAEQTKLGAMLAQGLRGFIPKPYTREKLLEQVRSTLDAARHQMR